jgi:membrane associated rhomboid family serine protease
LLPIRDLNPSRTRPLVTWLLVGAAVYVFFAIQPFDAEGSFLFLYEQASIPCEITTGEPLSAIEIRSGVCIAEEQAAVFPEKHVLASLAVSIFLHGNLAHLFGNMWMLWIFGNNVEDAMGRVGFGVFYGLAGILAGLAHVVMNPSSTIPVVGASGAIAGVMGAYLVLYPGAQVVSIIPPIFFLPFRVPALVFLGIWFLTQFGLAGQATSIAWEAHVAGFAIGVGYAALRRRTMLARHYRG